MTLRDSRINIFFKLGCLVASEGWDIWVSSICFKKSNTSRPQQPPTERVSYISEKWNFDDPFHKKGPILVILVPGMIHPSGSGSYMVKWGCWGHWDHQGCWGCWGHWGCRGSKAWKITTEGFRLIQVLELSFISMFLGKKNLWWNHEVSSWI